MPRPRARLVLLHIAVIVWTSVLVVGTAATYEHSAPCPINIADAESWCSDVFGRGGQLTVGEADFTHFECVCNAGTSIDVHVDTEGPGPPFKCFWSGVFEKFPGGEYCTAVTNLCPISCASIVDADICNTKLEVCTSDGPNYNYSCTTCAGQVYTIEGSASDCEKSITHDDLHCDPKTTCSGHGCCERPPPGSSTTQATCRCASDSEHGHWAGSNCDRCADGYESAASGVQCNSPTPKIQVILSSIAQTWTMVLPNIAVLFLFVVLGLARRLWDSDSDFEATRLRRANLSAVQIARRKQQGLFHSKYIPTRPAKSRSFANKYQSQTRGPPPY